MSSDAENYGGFFQFPLCLLAWKLPFADIMGRAIHYGVVSFLDKTDDGQNWRRNQTTREDALKKAQKVIGFTGGDIDRMIEQASEARFFTNQWSGFGRKTCDVRVRKDLVFGARDDKEPTEREFRILAGIFSAIGAKPYVKIGWLSVQCRAAGWLSTPPPITPDLPCGPVYPRGQIERTLAELLARSLVSGVTYRRGERYWSNRLTREQLWDAIKVRKLRRLQARSVHAASDAEKSAAIKEALGRP